MLQQPAAAVWYAQEPVNDVVCMKRLTGEDAEVIDRAHVGARAFRGIERGDRSLGRPHKPMSIVVAQSDKVLPGHGSLAVDGCRDGSDSSRRLKGGKRALGRDDHPGEPRSTSRNADDGTFSVNAIRFL